MRGGYDQGLDFGHPWSHRGTYWQFEDVVVEPPTARSPSAGVDGRRSPASIKKVARRATICCWPICSLEQVSEGLPSSRPRWSQGAR